MEFERKIHVMVNPIICLYVNTAKGDCALELSFIWINKVVSCELIGVVFICDG